MTGTGSIRPVFINSRAIGGSDWLYNSSTGAGQCGVVDGLGLNNIGLRVKVWGRVTHSETGFFYLDDGSNVLTDPGRTGVKVYGTAAEDIYVEVTGISASETSGDKIIRVIRSTDVQPVGGVPPPPPPF